MLHDSRPRTNRRWSTTAWIAIALVATVAAVRWSMRRDEPRVPAVADSSLPVESASNAPRRGFEEETASKATKGLPASAVHPIDRSLSAASSSLVVLVVRAGEEIPIADAAVSSQRLHETRQVVENAELDLAESEGRTGPDGTWRLEAQHIDPAAARFVWTSHPNHTTRGSIVQGGEARLLVELEPHPGLTVRAVDQDGNALAGAEIVEVALDPDLALATRRRALPTSVPDVPPERIPPFRRTFTTGPDGSTFAHPCDFPIVLHAHLGDLRSRPMIVEPDIEELVIELVEGVSAMGTVRFPPGFARADELRIHAFARPRHVLDDRGSYLLGSADVSPDGSWGPLALALDADVQLVFRSCGGGLVPVERVVDPRVLAPPFIVDFEPITGLALDVFVFEQADAGPQGLARALVDFRWLDEETSRIQRTASWTDAQGLARIEGCPETTGAVRASAVGFASKRVASVGLPRSLRLDIELVRGGGIEGRCSFAGRPVTDFDVMLWSVETSQRSVHLFRERMDGSFRVDGAPLGPVQVLAVSADHPESDIHRVEVRSDRVAHLELELPEPVIGRGRVVDAETREPIAHARIVPWISSSTELLEARGSNFTVDGTGQFEVSDFPPKNCTVFVEADGYGRTRADGSYRPGEGIEFGEIALSRAGDLLVRVLAEGHVDASELWILGEGSHPIPYHQMEPDGDLLIAGVQPGLHALNVVWQDGSYLCHHVELVAGRPWVVEFELPDRAQLAVDIVVEAGLESLEGTALLTTFRDSRGNKAIRGNPVPSDGQVLVRACDASELWLELIDSNASLLAFEHVHLAPNDPRHLTLRVTDRAISVRVADREQQPLPGVQVELATPDENQPASTYQLTDANGRTTFRGVHADEVLILAGSATLGHVVRQATLSPKGTTELEIVLDGGHDLTLAMSDGAEPVPGVSAILHGPTRAITVAKLNADSNGNATWPRLATGRYHVYVDHPGIWPSWHTFEFTGDPEPIAVPVRRLGNLELQVVDPDGLALRDVQLHLTSHEFGESVATWAAGHRVLVEPASSSTDALGKCVVRGIPHGSYTLSLTPAGGTMLQQKIVVPAADTLRHLVVLE